MQRALRLLLFLTAAFAAHAHPIIQNPVWIEATPEKVKLKLYVSVRELIVVQGLPMAADGGANLDEAIDLAPRHNDYVLDHFLVQADGKPVSGRVTEITPPAKVGIGTEGPDTSHFVYYIDYPLQSPPAVLSFSQTMCVEFPSAPGVPWDLSYATRYGPPGNPAQRMSNLFRGGQLRYQTGFLGAPELAGTVVRVPRPWTWAVLWICFVAAAAAGTNVGSLWYKGAAILWLGGYTGAEHAGIEVPGWGLALLCGAGTILAAVDNIHGHETAGQVRRRRVLLLAGALCFGFALHRQPPPPETGTRFWGSLLVLGAVAAAVVLGGLRALLARKGEKPSRLFAQLASFVCCAAAVWLMLQLVEAIPALETGDGAVAGSE